MGTNCAPLVADLFLFCYKIDFMDSLNHENQADVIEAFNSTSRYLDDFLNNDNPYFGQSNLSTKLHRYRSPLFRFTPFYCKWIWFLLKFMTNTMTLILIL